MLGLQYLFTFGNVGYWTLKSPTVVAVTRITFTLSWLMDFSLFLIPLFYKLFLEFAIIFYSCLQFSTSFGEQSTTPPPSTFLHELCHLRTVSYLEIHKSAILGIRGLTLAPLVAIVIFVSANDFSHTPMCGGSLT